MNSYRFIVEAATKLASSLPTSTVEIVSKVILATGNSNLIVEIVKQVPHHNHQDQVLDFVAGWQTNATDLDAKAVSIALQTAAFSEQTHKDSQSAELVWTGPESEGFPFRRTEQAILQLLDSALDRITLISFAVYHIPNIAKALVKAADRGVKLTVIVETPDKLDVKKEYSTIQALGPEVESCSSVYYWPKEKRKLGDNNKPGILHVKCAVADSKWLFLSSANLTKQAFTINMELGMLVRGGKMPRRIEQKFDHLIKQGILVHV
tara:strand:- start:5013 stop:5804 length:792 start_codon:yes stop_codon:yes gene_type:complete